MSIKDASPKNPSLEGGLQLIKNSGIENNNKAPLSISFKIDKDLEQTEKKLNNVKTDYLDFDENLIKNNIHSNKNSLYESETEILIQRALKKIEAIDKEEEDLNLIESLTSISEALPFSDNSSNNSRNSSNNSLFSDDLSCLTYNLDSKKTKNICDQSNICSSINTNSLSNLFYDNNQINKHLIISEKNSPKIIFGSKLPIGVCCILKNKQAVFENLVNKNSENNETKSCSFLTNKSEFISNNCFDNQNKFIDSHKSNKLFCIKKNPNIKESLNLENYTSINQMSCDNKPQLSFTRYSTIEDDDSQNINLLAIDHLPLQYTMQDDSINSNIKNITQARLIKTNLLKKKFSMNKSQLNDDNININSNPAQSNFQSIPIKSINWISNSNKSLHEKNQIFCDQNKNNSNYIKNFTCENNNCLEKPIQSCLECEKTKKIFQKNCVHLIPVSMQTSPAPNDNTSPMSLQISPLNTIESITSSAKSACSNQNNSGQTTLSSSSLCGQSILKNSSNVFNYDPATTNSFLSKRKNKNFHNLKQNEFFTNDDVVDMNLVNIGSSNIYLLPNNILNENMQCQNNLNDSLTEETILFSKNSKHKFNKNEIEPSSFLRSASSCAQYSSLASPTMQNNCNSKNFSNQSFNHHPKSIITNSNFSRSEQNLVSSQNYLYNLNNAANNFNQNSQSYLQQHVVNSKQPVENTFNRSCRLSIRTPSPTLITSSSFAGDSGLESPSVTYVDNNDSVNIFNKYQLSSSANARFNSHFYTGPKEHDFFRKAVPTLPIIIAIFLCIFNWFLPGSGTILGSIAVLIGCKTEYGRDKWKTAFFLCILAGILQFLTAIIVVGWVWSVMWGVNFIKNATKKNNKKYLMDFAESTMV